ncbi:MAG TPA: SDR family oxidoreductase, partial [Acidimicrobiales bacterium]|nr:SDR family oxidoreductase [Acidimicrobiales bacterium]
MSDVSLLGLTGKRTLVTGGGAGLGQAIAQWLARAGCDVAVADLDAEAAATTVKLIEAEGRSGIGILANVRDEAQVANMVDQTVAGLGGVDVAVNNVGNLAGRPAGPFIEMDSADVREIIEQNLLATALCCQAEARAMITQGAGGCIINVSSGESTRPAITLAPYGAAKSGINHLTSTLAVELGPYDIRVNAIAPGTTLTATVGNALPADYLTALVASHPLSRLNQAEDLARIAVFMASDLAQNVTG